MSIRIVAQSGGTITLVVIKEVIVDILTVLGRRQTGRSSLVDIINSPSSLPDGDHHATLSKRRTTE